MNWGVAGGGWENMTPCPELDDIPDNVSDTYLTPSRSNT